MTVYVSRVAEDGRDIWQGHWPTMKAARVFFAAADEDRRQMGSRIFPLRYVRGRDMEPLLREAIDSCQRYNEAQEPPREGGAGVGDGD